MTMLYYAIFDSTANLVDSYDREDEARQALDEIAHQDPDHADDYAIITYGDDGLPVGDAIVGSRPGVPA